VPELSDIDHVAIVGMAGRLPGADDLDEFWLNLRDGVESITWSTEDDLLAAGLRPDLIHHPDFVPAHGNLARSAEFDAEFFGYSVAEAELMDPQQRLFLECAYHAIENANIAPPHFSDRVCVYAGTGLNGYVLRNVLTRPDLLETFGEHNILLNSDKDFLATRVAYKLGLSGSSVSVQTACSTSLVAVHMACQSLLTYQCDAALAGGVRVGPFRRSGYLYQPGGIASPDGHCRAYDAAGQGTVGGDGAGAVVLKRLSDAKSDGDTIHAVILGSASNNDGASKAGFTAPSISGQAAVITEALEMAGVSASTISYVEGHGTATQLGDPTEIAALTRAFRRFTDKRQYCALGTVKSNIGHLDTAAGIAGLLKTVLALRHCQVPPSLHFSEPNPAIDFAASPFYVNTRLVPWGTSGGVPRRAGVSSFGIGGTNAHVVLQEAPAAVPARPGVGPELIVVSAHTREALAAASAALGAQVRERPELDLGDVAHTLRVGRRTHRWRRFVVAADRDEAAAKLVDPDLSAAGAVNEEAMNRPVYFMFPGGGTAYARMGQDLYERYPVFRSALDECAQSLKHELGLDIRTVLYPAAGAAEEAAGHLARAAVNLPAIVAVEYALSALFMSCGVQPRAMIGHSLGEYTAACLSGVLSLSDCMSLVALRGRLFDQLPQGAMLTVNASPEHLAARLPAGLSMAAVNAPESCVVSGATELIDRFEEQLVRSGMQPLRLKAPGAAHSELIDQVLAEYGQAVAGISVGAPRLPYVSNVTGGWAEPGLVGDPGYWTRHLRQTVRFSEGVSLLKESGEGVFLEVGPGRGLSSLVRQHGSPAPVSVASLRRASEGLSDVVVLTDVLGQLWTAGADVNWSALPASPRRRVPLPGYPFERREHWVEPGAGSALGSVKAQLSRPANTQDMAGWFDTPAWRPSPLLNAPAPLPEAEPWLVFTDGGPLGRQLSGCLARQGADVIEVVPGQSFVRDDDRRYQLNPAAPGHYTKLIADLDGRQLSPRHVAHLWSLNTTAASDGDVAAFEQAQPAGFYSLLFLAQALEGAGRTEAPVAIHVVGSGLHSVTGSETLDPWHATVLGACRVLPQECAKLSCRLTDLESVPGDEAAARRVATWLMTEWSAPLAWPATTAYRAGRRWIPDFEPVAVPAPATDPFRVNGSYLITGGIDEFAETFAGHLVRRYAARVTIVEREGFPQQDDWDAWIAGHSPNDPVSERIQRVRSLAGHSGHVKVVTADAASADGLRGAVRTIHERVGALHGVFHTAGLSEERIHHLVGETTMAACQEHFRRQAHSTIALATVLDDEALDFCLVVSTLSAQLGGFGRLASVASAAFAGLYAEQRRRADSTSRWFSSDWDDGQFQIAADRTTDLSPPFTPEQTASAAGRIVALPSPLHLVVLADDLGARLRYWQRLDPAGHETGEPAGSRRPRPALPVPHRAARDSIEKEILAVWEPLLGIEAIGIDDDFFSLGGHSMLGTQLVSRLRSAFGVDLPLRDLFESPTVAEMAERIVQLTAAQSDADELVQLLAELEQQAEENTPEI
jgi:acyl transferase domain-containing protein